MSTESGPGAAVGGQVQVEFLTMHRAVNRLRDAADQMNAEQRRVLDSRDGYRHAVSPELARALDSFADRWTLALSSLAQVIDGAADELHATEATFRVSDEDASSVMSALRNRR